MRGRHGGIITVRAPRPKGEEQMTVWRITGGDSESGVPRPERASPRYDLVELDSPLLHIAGATGSPWLRLTGEIDVSNVPALTRALHGAQARAGGDVHVDLAGVGFVDVSGLRAFARAARDLHDLGHMLVLHSVSAHIDRLVRLIGWNAAPGLQVHCRPRT
ncbi:anti-sigma factor antagonist [Actinomadura sp. WAC 06369]|nr:anti-sigma factor antagonist [Actinomadura sp. WAC 06369]